MNFPKLLLGVLLLNVSLFANIPSALADNAPQVFHETDSGKTITINVGETVKFSLAENHEPTSCWLCGFAYAPAVAPVAITTGMPIYDETQSPKVLTTTTYSCFGEKAGEVVIYFCHQDKSGNYINPIIFSVIVTNAGQ